MSLRAVKKVAVILLVVVVLRYMGLCDNFLNRFFFAPSPIRSFKNFGENNTMFILLYIVVKYFKMVNSKNYVCQSLNSRKYCLCKNAHFVISCQLFNLRY